MSDEDFILRVVVVTDIPSPYQVQLFDAIASVKPCDLMVLYVRRSATDRLWETTPILHDHCFLVDVAKSEIGAWVGSCDLAVFSGYWQAKVGRLIALRNRTCKAWAFWGERPGYRFPGWLGYHYRAWALRHLRFSRAPIWGIGEWAVDGYRSWLGPGRCFFNVPYFSNLNPFFAIERRFACDKARRFLFSGSFIRRKGVDLLVSAFTQLVKEGFDVELHLLGSGPLETSLKRQLSLCPCKVHLHGFKQWRDLASVYANADVLCVPSRYDGWGLVVAEGLAAGMPVISTDSTGAARELIEPRNGWIVPGGNETALLSAMRTAATVNIECLQEMSQSARQTARHQDIEPGVECFAQTAEMTLEAWRQEVRQIC